MKRLLSFLSALLLCGGLHAQGLGTEGLPAYPEPEFVGQTCLLLSGGGVAELDRELLRVRTRETTGSVLFGIGKLKTEAELDEPAAVVRVCEGDTVRFIVRTVDNNFDPVVMVNIFRFDTSKRGVRRVEIASVSTFGSVKPDKLERLRFTATKYGSASYLITLRRTPPGEYAIALNNSYCMFDDYMVVSTFGIDPK